MGKIGTKQAMDVRMAFAIGILAKYLFSTFF